MKKLMSVLLVAVLVISLAACGSSKEPTVPDDTVYREDVQEYVSELLDSTATISIFEKTGSEVVDGTLTVTCVAMYSGSDGDNKGTFTLTYSNNGKEWTLEKCRVDLGDTNTADQTEDTAATQETEVQKPPASATPGNNAYSLTQVGTIKDSDRTLTIRYDSLQAQSGDTAKLLSYLGESKNDIEISDVGYLGQGVYAVKDTSGDVNSVGLISREGEVLIPCEACKIDWPNDMYDENGRYLRVLYTTGETDNIDECFVYASNNGWSFGGPQAGDTMYTGYALVYDLETKSFVNDVKITNSDSYAMQTCGNTFAVKDEDGITKLYNANGEVLFQTAHNMDVGGGTFIVSDNGTYRVYDENGNQTYTSNKGLYLINGMGGYINKYEDDREVIMDRDGNQVAGAVFEGVYSEMNDVFTVKNNGKYGLVHADGTVILACDTYSGSISYIDFGFYNTQVETESGYSYTLIGSNGVIAENLPSGTTSLKAMDGETAFVVNDGDYTLKLETEYVDTLAIGMISAQSDSNGMYGVFDLLTGEQLLGYEYEKVQTAAGYLYAYKNGAWEVYQINEPV